MGCGVTVFCGTLAVLEKAHGGRLADAETLNTIIQRLAEVEHLYKKLPADPKWKPHADDDDDQGDDDLHGEQVGDNPGSGE